MATTAKAGRKARPIEDSDSFTDVERDAMKARAREVKKYKAKPKAASDADAAAENAAAITALVQPERGMAERLAALVAATAPELKAKTWYGMPAWAKDGKVLFHFVSATKFKTRYASIGFSEEAALDEGKMWPTAFALLDLGPAEEKKIAALLRRAMG